MPYMHMSPLLFIVGTTWPPIIAGGSLITYTHPKGVLENSVNCRAWGITTFCVFFNLEKPNGLYKNFLKVLLHYLNNVGKPKQLTSCHVSDITHIYTCTLIYNIF